MRSIHSIRKRIHYINLASKKQKFKSTLCCGPINFLHTILFKVVWPVKLLMGIGQKLTLNNYASNE